MYAQYVPQDQYIEVHGFEASNTSTADDSHIVCLDRTVHHPNSATVFTELYIVDDRGETYEIDSETSQRYFQGGTDTIKTPYPLPPEIEAGDYRYRMVVQMDLAQGRVSRTFVFHSDSFTVTDSNETTEHSYKGYEC